MPLSTCCPRRVSQQKLVGRPHKDPDPKTVEELKRSVLKALRASGMKTWDYRLHITEIKQLRQRSDGLVMSACRADVSDHIEVSAKRIDTEIICRVKLLLKYEAWNKAFFKLQKYCSEKSIIVTES